MPMPIQNVLHGTPDGDERADDELAGRAAGHAEHLRGADERRGCDAGKFVVAM